MKKHADLLGRLLPPVAYDLNARRINSELVAEGNALDAAMTAADAIAASVTPFEAFALLPDYERLLAIVPDPNSTIQHRIAMVIAKLNETGGLSIPYFIQLAQSLGYSITIVEPQPFRVDSSTIGDTIYHDDIVYQWEVVVDGAPDVVYYFRVGQSAVGERLMSFSDPVLEAVFQDLKPAHTFVYFAYTGGN